MIKIWLFCPFNKIGLKFVFLFFMIWSSCSRNQPPQGPYEANWESLAGHNAEPQWLADAKLGIYFHWGVYSVPAFGSEWYPRNMHIEGHSVFEHHLEMYGDPSEFGYHDFVPLFKAEKFDPEAWADLFVETGVRFAGLVVEHHDGFSMWASDQTPWNVGDMGPQRDITGELAKAFRARGLRLITTFHHARNLQRYRDKVDEEQFQNSHYPFIEGWPPTSDDQKLQQLYGNLPEDQWLEQMWLGKLKEVVDHYQPDIVWFDSWLDQIPESYRRTFCAYYLNRAGEWGKDVVIVHKQDDLPLDVSIIDMEKSRMPAMNEHLWMTDDTISRGSWCYTTNLTIKSAKKILHSFIDIISKNGVLLLNISPKADGTIPSDQQSVLREIGQWMKTYGEAVYGSRPWKTYGEGPIKEPEGGFQDHQQFLNLSYSAKDIRYTTQGNTVYAFVMGWPGDEQPILMKAFAGHPMDVGEVSMLGSDENVQWEQVPEGLKVTTLSEKTSDIALVFEIEHK